MSENLSETIEMLSFEVALWTQSSETYDLSVQEHSRMHSISRSFRAQRSVAMNPRQLALFLGFYFYVINVSAGNDAQRIILLASLVQIRAL